MVTTTQYRPVLYKRVKSPVASAVANREHRVGRSPVHSDTGYPNIRIPKLKVIEEIVKGIEELVEVIEELANIESKSYSNTYSNNYRGLKFVRTFCIWSSPLCDRTYNPPWITVLQQAREVIRPVANEMMKDSRPKFLTGQS